MGPNRRRGSRWLGAEEPGPRPSGGRRRRRHLRGGHSNASVSAIPSYATAPTPGGDPSEPRHLYGGWRRPQAPGAASRWTVFGASGTGSRCARPSGAARPVGRSPTGRALSPRAVGGRLVRLWGSARYYGAANLSPPRADGSTPPLSPAGWTPPRRTTRTAGHGAAGSPYPVPCRAPHRLRYFAATDRQPASRHRRSTAHKPVTPTPEASRTSHPVTPPTSPPGDAGDPPLPIGITTRKLSARRAGGPVADYVGTIMFGDC